MRPLAPLSGLEPAGLSFVHPQATREIRLLGHHVAYEMRWARRRSIGFTVSPQGLRVSAAPGVGVGEIHAALQAKAAWIVRKLTQVQQVHQQAQAARWAWADGSVLPYLGGSLTLRLDETARGAKLDAGASLGCEALVLRLGLSPVASGDTVRVPVQRWLQKQGLPLFSARCKHFAPLLGVQPTRLGLSNARTRWGSASSSGAIRLNWRLIHFPVSTIDYVVVHELAHLLEMNHSPRFWSLVERVLPGYEAERQHLRQQSLGVLGA
jgi:predicted metal-dependent hydrolase